MEHKIKKSGSRGGAFIEELKGSSFAGCLCCISEGYHQ